MRLSAFTDVYAFLMDFVVVSTTSSFSSSTSFFFVSLFFTCAISGFYGKRIAAIRKVYNTECLCKLLCIHTFAHIHHIDGVCTHTHIYIHTPFSICNVCKLHWNEFLPFLAFSRDKCRMVEEREFIKKNPAKHLQWVLSRRKHRRTEKQMQTSTMWQWMKNQANYLFSNWNSLAFSVLLFFEKKINKHCHGVLFKWLEKVKKTKLYTLISFSHSFLSPVFFFSKKKSVDNDSNVAHKRLLNTSINCNECKTQFVHFLISQNQTIFQFLPSINFGIAKRVLLPFFLRLFPFSFSFPFLCTHK